MEQPRSWTENLAGTTVLVTGGGGLIGSRIVALLRRVGARPLILCALDAYPRHVYTDLFGVRLGDLDLHAGDVADTALLARLVSGCDYVIHAAALADVAACTRDPQAAIHTNVTGTQAVLQAVAATERVRRLVFVSSASVYGDGDLHDTAPPDPAFIAIRQLSEFQYGRMAPQFTEYTKPSPLSVYANTKLWGEMQTALLLGSVGTSYTVLRYFSVYGEPQTVKEGSHSWVVAWFAARAALGLPLHLNGGGHQVRDLVHVDDIAEATVRALAAPRAHNETINVGTGVPTSIRDVAALVRQHYPDAQLSATPMPLGDPRGGYANVTHMQRVLDWKPTIGVADGVARYADWLHRTPDAIPAWLREGAATL
ncbi:NAD-dependent epimerase/dehydratase family protein [Peterkaempfera bronchialis]|uniref:NAD-dependent epimerase/dehydratase family protein n=1 Tax=Peterkaempfera bronchialis TaxID=2126346 RepID=UPI003C2C42B6